MLMDNGSNLKFVNFLLKTSIATNRKMNPAYKISERKRDILCLPVTITAAARWWLEGIQNASAE